MNSDRRVKPVVLLRQLDRAVERARPRSVAIADGEQGADAGLVGASDNVGAVCVEALAIEMSVGVGVHQRQPSAFSRQPSARTPLTILRIAADILLRLVWAI